MVSPLLLPTPSLQPQLPEQDFVPRWFPLPWPLEHMTSPGTLAPTRCWPDSTAVPLPGCPGETGNSMTAPGESEFLQRFQRGHYRGSPRCHRAGHLLSVLKEGRLSGDDAEGLLKRGQWFKSGSLRARSSLGKLQGCTDVYMPPLLCEPLAQAALFRPLCASPYKQWPPSVPPLCPHAQCSHMPNAPTCFHTLPHNTHMIPHAPHTPHAPTLPHVPTLLHAYMLPHAHTPSHAPILTCPYAATCSYTSHICPHAPICP